MNQRRGGDQTILDRHRLSGGAKLREEFGLAQAGRGLPGQTMNLLNPSREPAFQLSPPRAGGQEINAKPYLAQNDRVHGNLAFVRAKPFDHPCRRLRLGRFAQNIGVDKVGHRVR